MFNSLRIAIASSDVTQWLDTNPAVFRLLQLVFWGTEHPIWGLIILLVTLALIWNLFKGFSYLVVILAKQIVQAPLKLTRLIWRVSTKSMQQVSTLALKQLTGKKTTELPALPPANSPPVQIDKQQRLAEISHRLTEIQKEQNELLQEVAVILGSDKINVEVTQELTSKIT
ncbi:hypothetical protein NIES2119_16480 [[Phormidium ambiguum] IAM M-71]|uniref:Uncharacterized protein n=1 Tax=[Phormidium ambiguum] IAM M-71 TaxID=454136 RepID=A0A1U7IHK8_9CYAN|nr:hypothetical protein [Phormidium ambiguum]OKH36625.1 hypothetical protein NIES2119_16480 [Phormidium ambiguum IAM M-71]